MDEDDSLPPPRSAPPSPRDLREVRSLVEPSSGEALRGRRIMVPLTTKAFFEGTLRPSTTTAAASASTSVEKVSTMPPPVGGGGKGSSIDDERVMVNLEQGYQAEMTRGEAVAAIDRRIASAVGGVVVGGRVAGGKMAAAKTRKTSRKRNAAKNNRERSSKAPEKSAAKAVQSPSLPFFEIREEYDERGNEISSQAYNVAEGLERLKREVKAKTDGGGKEAAEIGEAIGKMRIDADDDDDEDDGDDDGGEVVSDEKFETLSSRLDELARLEEEDERNKKISRTSRQRIQGNAWGKGFLEGGKKKKKKKNVEGSVQDSVTEQNRGHAKADLKAVEEGPKKKQAQKKNKGWATGFLEKKPGEKRRSKGVSKPLSPPDVEATAEPKRKVAFGADQVKEIPRIGETSIKEATRDRQGGSSDGPKLFESDAFSGVVKERPVAGQRTPVLGGISDRTAGANDLSEDHAPTKRISRFAQQRQQLR